MVIERRKAIPPTIATQQAVVELMPGHVALGRAGDQFKTLLGSCVSVILTDPRRTVGAMCHIVHVGRPNQANAHNTAFGEIAMQEMFDCMIDVAIPPARCQAYVYGGGNMFPQMFSTTHVGAKNAEWVLDFLHHFNIAIAGQDLGGNGYRKVAWTVGRQLPTVETIRSGF